MPLPRANQFKSACTPRAVLSSQNADGHNLIKDDDDDDDADHDEDDDDDDDDADIVRTDDGA